ncbi:cytochrome P450, family 4, subfamily f, polypeptide 15, isoform CRA_a [Mus musculus]|nr:cytochrome P450, family 4, subfamily f, polypeptide 15, isoform CRA_a [Mus musculus]
MGFFRMPQLDLSWLGLRLEASSPWLLLLLIGASWLLARVLTQTYIFYRTYHHLCDFPQPPKWNWFLGHLGMITPTEHGLKEVTNLVATYPQMAGSYLKVLSASSIFSRPITTQLCGLTLRFMTPSALTQRISRTGHLWLLFPSPLGPGTA